MDAVFCASERAINPPADIPPCFDCSVPDVRALLSSELTRHYVPEGRADSIFDDATCDAAADLIREFGGPWRACQRHGGE